MALRWCDGFTYLVGSGGGFGAGVKYDTGTTNMVRAATGRNNGIDAFCLTPSTTAAATAIVKNVTISGDVIVGFAYYWPAGLTSSRRILELREGSTVHGTLEADSANRTLVFTRNGTVLGTSSVVVGAALDEWSYIEVKAKTHDTLGTVEVRVWASTVLTLTNVDTRNAGTAGAIDNVRLGRLAAAGESPRFDDYYIADTSGTTNNDFLAYIDGGSIVRTPRVIDLEPIGAGSAAQWSPLSGTNWDQAQDGTATDGDTSYNAATTVGFKDLLDMTAMPAGIANIKGLLSFYTARKDDAAARSVAPLLKSGATESQGTDLSLTTTYQTPAWRVFETDPDTGVAWTESGVNAHEQGYKVTV